MPTEAQISANRENATKSTGPRTAEGKAASSRNHLTHGLCADQHLLADGDANEFLTLYHDFFDRHRPVGPVEEALVMRIACNHWRLNRALLIDPQIHRECIAQVQAANSELPPEDLAAESDFLGPAFMIDCARSQSLLKLTRYEAALERSTERCRRQLDQYQKSRAATPAGPPPSPETEITLETQTNEGIPIPANEDFAPVSERIIPPDSVLDPGEVIHKSLPTYTQDPTETLHIAIAGPAAALYSRLTVHRTAHLDGTLHISLLDGYLPTIGQTFTIITSPQIYGGFRTVTGAAIAPGLEFMLTQTHNEVALTVVPCQSSTDAKLASSADRTP